MIDWKLAKKGMWIDKFNNILLMELWIDPRNLESTFRLSSKEPEIYMFFDLVIYHTRHISQQAYVKGLYMLGTMDLNKRNQTCPKERRRKKKRICIYTIICNSTIFSSTGLETWIGNDRISISVYECYCAVKKKKDERNGFVETLINLDEFRQSEISRTERAIYWLQHCKRRQLWKP